MATVDIGADEYRCPTERNPVPANWFVPGWVWFSIPLYPWGSADASDVLGFDARNRLFAWDDTRKNLRLYPDDFTDLVVGRSYTILLDATHVPVYEGAQPDLPFERTLPAAGSGWVGVPSTQIITGVDLSVQKRGQIRAPEEDRDAPDPWLNWNWIYWDPNQRAAKIMNPLGVGDDRMLHPWWGYRVWSNTENVTIIFP